MHDFHHRREGDRERACQDMAERERESEREAREREREREREDVKMICADVKMANVDAKM